MTHPQLNILADENIPALDRLFGRLGRIRRMPGRSIRQQDLVDTDLLLVRSITRVDAALLDGTPVRFVGTATIGTDHIDQAYLTQRGVRFSSAPGCNADAVVEYVLTVLYQLGDEQGFRLQDRTVGIIGVGNVGARLQARLESLGVRLLLNDPPRAGQQPDGFVDLETLLERADIVSMHTPLVRSGPWPTHHLLDSDRLRRLRSGAILLNAGRGAAIDNQALLALTGERPDLTLVLDVWEHEPVVDPALAARVRIATPHIAGYSLDGKIRGTHMLCQAACDFLGVAPPGPLTDYLPPAPVRYLGIGPELAPLEPMRLLYDPYRDDRALRGTLALPPAQRGEAFDRLRKEYPVRREFVTLELRGEPESGRAGELAALGFGLDLA